MRTLFFFLVLILTLQSQAQKGFKITRYEVKQKELFICINSTERPVFVERFLTKAERNDSTSIRATIEEMVAELQIKESEYSAPEVAESKMDVAKRIEKRIDTTRVKAAKVRILSKMQLERDSLARQAEFRPVPILGNQIGEYRPTIPILNR